LWAAPLARLAFAAAAQAAPVPIDVPAGRLRDSLVALSQQTGISIGVSGKLPTDRAPAVHGLLEPGIALDHLLVTSRWRAVRVDGMTWRIEARPVPAVSAVAPPSLSAADDIIITATKRDERLSNIPAAISIMPLRAIAAPGSSHSVGDLLSQTEGAFSTNLGAGRDRIFLRGVADSPFNGPTQSTVGLYLDDARISYATPDPDLRLVDVDRVELLRGPQGALYGTGSLGGIVRLVTTRPDLDHWSGGGAIEASAVMGGAAGGAVDAVINAPLIDGRLGLRAVGYTELMPGWIDDSQRHRNNINRVYRSGGRVALRWRPVADWTVDGSFVGQWLNARDSQYATSGLTHATALAEPHDNDFVAGRIEVHGRIADLDVLSASAIVSHKADSRFDASVVAAARGLTPPLAYQEDRQLTLLTQELRVSDPRARHPWVVGGSVLIADNSNIGAFVPTAGTSVVVRDQDERSLEAAIFGEATQSLPHRFDLTIGLRIFRSVATNEAGPVRQQHLTKIGVTPSATIAWRPADNRLFWLRYASAIRPGGLNGDATGMAGSRPTFRSDELRSLELGGRATLLNGKIALDGTLFALSWEDLQSDVIGTDGLVTTINAGNARSFGAEFSTKIMLMPLTVEGGMTLQHGRLNGPGPIQGGNDDRHLPVVPDISGHIRLSATAPIGAMTGDAFVSMRYVGKARLSFDPAVALHMGDYIVVDSGVSLTRGTWKASVGITNIANGHGDSFSFGNPFTFRTVDQQTPIRPRTASVRIERRF
jgi:outer membrane receptor protein involved in Fe transport